MTNKIILEIWRSGHHYSLNYSTNGEIRAQNQPITREEAERHIRAHANGRIPENVNLDVCHPRYWTHKIVIAELSPALED